MRRAAIVSPLRTPVGTFGGSLRPVPVEELAAITLRALLERSCIDPARIDDVVFAQSYASSETPCVGRWAALQAGLPVQVPGMQLDRRCVGGLQAVVTAAMMVQSGAADVVVAGVVESMSNIEYYTTDMGWGARAGSVTVQGRLERGRERSQPVERFGVISGMIETAENLARDYGITREAADAYALRSHQRAAAAWAEGRFDAEIVPVSVPQKKGDPKVFARDEGFRPETTMDTLAKLRPLIQGGTVTAGNASQQNDAAAACLVVAEHKLMERLKLRIDQMDLVELNEAFACQVLAVLKGLQWDDPARLNVNGSGISLGHPIGATGVRMLSTLLHELQRRGGRYGLETMCIGGGQGIAAVFERS